jgi:hypothetical protein
MAQFESIRFQPSRPLLKELSADRLNSILAEIRKNRPRGERGITVRQSGDATYIGLATTPRGGGGGFRRQPWDIVARKDPDSEEQYLLTVRPGIINGILPTNWEDEFTAADSGLYYGKIIIATDNFSITGVTIDIDTEPPALQTPQKFEVETEVEYLFGIFGEGQSYNLVGSGNLLVSPRLWITTSADPPAEAGESPFDLYYALV